MIIPHKFRKRSHQTGQTRGEFEKTHGTIFSLCFHETLERRDNIRLAFGEPQSAETAFIDYNWKCRMFELLSGALPTQVVRYEIYSAFHFIFLRFSRHTWSYPRRSLLLHIHDPLRNDCTCELSGKRKSHARENPLLAWETTPNLNYLSYDS